MRKTVFEVAPRRGAATRTHRPFFRFSSATFAPAWFGHAFTVRIAFPGVLRAVMPTFALTATWTGGLNFSSGVTPMTAWYWPGTAGTVAVKLPAAPAVTVAAVPTPTW